MAKEDKSNEQGTLSLEQYRNTWAESLEQFQKVMEAGQPYLKTWTEPLELFQQTIAASASYLKTWSESLEQFQRVMEASAPYLKTWKEFLEQYETFMETSAPYLKTWAESLESLPKDDGDKPILSQALDRFYGAISKDDGYHFQTTLRSTAERVSTAMSCTMKIMHPHVPFRSRKIKQSVSKAAPGLYFCLLPI